MFRSFSLNSDAIRRKRAKHLPQIGFPSLRSVKSDRLLALQTFLKVFAHFQLDEMMTWWAEDATAFFPVEHQRQRPAGKATIRSAFAQIIARGHAAGMTQLTVNVEDMQAQELGDFVVITFHLRGEPLCRRSFVLRQIQDQWRIVHLHASNAPLVVIEG
jgi:ketosteroid isomerase-like protein